MKGAKTGGGGSLQQSSILNMLQKKLGGKQVYLHHWPERKIDTASIKLLKAANCQTVDYLDKDLSYVLTSLSIHEVNILMKEGISSLFAVLQKNSPKASSPQNTQRMGFDQLTRALKMNIQIISIERLWRWVEERKETTAPSQQMTPSAIALAMETGDVFKLHSPALKVTFQWDDLKPLYHEYGNYLQHYWLPSALVVGTSPGSGGRGSSSTTTPLRPPAGTHCAKKRSPISTSTHSLGKLLHPGDPVPRPPQAPSASPKDDGSEFAKPKQSVRKEKVAVKSKKNDHFCEFCQVKYFCILQHMDSALHKSKACTPGMYKLIDQMITTLPSFEDVLQSSTTGTKPVIFKPRRSSKNLPTPPVFTEPSASAEPPTVIYPELQPPAPTSPSPPLPSASTVIPEARRMMEEPKEEHQLQVVQEQEKEDTSERTLFPRVVQESVPAFEPASPEFESRFRKCHQCGFWHVPRSWPAHVPTHCTVQKEAAAAAHARLPTTTHVTMRPYFPMKKPLATVQFSSPQPKHCRRPLSQLNEEDSYCRTEPGSPMLLSPVPVTSTKTVQLKRRRHYGGSTDDDNDVDEDEENGFHSRRRRSRVWLDNVNEVIVASPSTRRAKLDASSRMFIHSNYC